MTTQKLEMARSRATVPFVDPSTGEALVQRDGSLVGEQTQRIVAPIVDGVPRFVKQKDNYAESFAWQWKKWDTIRSDSRGEGYRLRDEIMRRTHFDEYDLVGKTILECGMGGGDDTEALLTMPFSEIHSFDISTAVERAIKYLEDDRLVISQASILDMPYADRSFDIVFCHRVLQHTPNPATALRRVCAKVKPGGILFAHCYKRSRQRMAEWRYKYRWLAKRLPLEWVYWYVEHCGPALHWLNARLYAQWPLNHFAYRFVPFDHMHIYTETEALSSEQLLELEKCTTFDALTPWHDHPMKTKEFCGIIEDAGFQIDHLHDPEVSPLLCTAVRVR